MSLSRVVIRDDFNHFLSGKEVNAALIGNSGATIEAGEKVLAFKDSVAGTHDVTVPAGELHRSMGIESIVTMAGNKTAAAHDKPLLKVKKV